MKRLVLAALLAAPLFWSCGKHQDNKDPEPVDTTVELKLADPAATPETKALYSNLWAIREHGWMFGHHDDLMYGRKWYGTEGGSDTKDVCGDYPAVYALDLSTLMDDRYDDLSEADDNALRKKLVKEAYDRGMVVMACLHMDNPLDGDDSWIDQSKPVRVAAEILKEGSETRRTFNEWLDRLAELAKSFKGSDGKIYSGRVYAKVKRGWTYGYIEGRIKLPKGKGTWPAFWMMPVNFRSWPADGEIDIMEEVGYHPNYVSSSLHANAHVHSNGTQVTHEMLCEGAEDDYHVYGIEWTADRITTYVDGQLQLEYANRGLGRDDWPYDAPFYIILNLAWGGDWGGAKGVDEGALPAEMLVDYVRVYQKSGSTAISTPAPVAAAKADDHYYDLSGRLIPKPVQRGAYIHNHKIYLQR